MWRSSTLRGSSELMSCSEHDDTGGIEVFGVVMLLKEAEFASQIIEFLLAPLEQKTAAVTDNKSARDVIKCPGATKRTVHTLRPVVAFRAFSRAHE
jgi:hypothetical protein